MNFQKQPNWEVGDRVKDAHEALSMCGTVTKVEEVKVSGSLGPFYRVHVQTDQGKAVVMESFNLMPEQGWPPEVTGQVQSGTRIRGFDSDGNLFGKEMAEVYFEKS